MASEGLFSLSMASVLEEVLNQHGTRLSDLDLASRKAEEAAARRYEAARWLRKTVGAVTAKDLPDQPSEEEFRLGLRNGLILCSSLNKVHPGAVPKVVVNPEDSIPVPDGAALSAYQYFENVRNFLVAVQEIGLPSFEASDLEQGGKGSRVVNCVLALKSYGEWKQTGGSGSWKFGGSLKPTVSGKTFARNFSERFTNSISRTQSINQREGLCVEQNSNGDLSTESTATTTSNSLNMLVRAVLSDKKPEEVPMLVGSMLSKVMEEFERRIASQNELVKSALKGLGDGNKSFSRSKVLAGPASACEIKMETEGKEFATSKKEDYINKNSKDETASKDQLLKQRLILDRQLRDIQELKCTLRTTRAGMEFMQRKYSEEFSNLGKHVYGIAHAASSYHKVLEENRKLYNQVQDLKGSIRVYCRVRPFLPGQSSSSTVARIEDDGNITITTPSKYGKDGQRSFNFNKVFGPSASQEEVFSDTQPLIRSVLDGYNVCIFAYGQTGSGKTYTMSGPKEYKQQNQGVNYRALGDLFNLSEQRRGAFSYEISVQMIEIYNEQVRDLLVSDGLNRRLEICNSSQTGLNVPNAHLVPVASTSDVIELMSIGQKNRAVGATALNDRSSRSHSCLTVHVQGTDTTSGTILRGCMHLVDLAGSERVEKSQVTGERLKEAQYINKSLSALGDVISSLAQKNSHVPYRNSKLTQLLQDSLGGQAKTLMFVHISPEMDSIGETISTLKFAERVSTVELGVARLNKESGEVKELKEQIASLKAALARKEGDSVHLRDMICSPDTFKTKASAPSYLSSNQQSGEVVKSYRSNQRQPMEDVGNIEVRRKSALRQKRPSFDLQELLIASDSPPWLNNGPTVNLHKDNNKEIGSGDWVDKVMVNKNGSIIGDDSSMGDWDGDGAPLPDFFYQRYLSDMALDQGRQCNKNSSRRKNSYDFEMPSNRFDAATTDGSDDLDVATSDSSEPDLLCQFNLPKVTNSGIGDGSRIKKPQQRRAPSPDIRTPIHANIPSPAKKKPNAPDRMERQPNSSGGFSSKRNSSSGKTSSAK